MHMGAGLSSLTLLRKLNVCGCRITDNVMNALAFRLTNLECLNLYKTAISGNSVAAYPYL